MKLCSKAWGLLIESMTSASRERGASLLRPALVALVQGWVLDCARAGGLETLYVNPLSGVRLSPGEGKGDGCGGHSLSPEVGRLRGFPRVEKPESLF